MAALIQNRWPRPDKSDDLAGDLSSTVQKLSRQGEPDLIVLLSSRVAMVPAVVRGSAACRSIGRDNVS